MKPGGPLNIIPSENNEQNVAWNHFLIYQSLSYKDQ